MNRLSRADSFAAPNDARQKKLLPVVIMLLLIGCAAAPRGPELLADGVRFTLPAPKAVHVAITGSFNRWDPRGEALSGPDRRGVWSITLPLSPGRYEYAFIIDGTTWTIDPGSITVDDGFGGKNSVVEVGK